MPDRHTCAHARTHIHSRGRHDTLASALSQNPGLSASVTSLTNDHQAWISRRHPTAPEDSSGKWIRPQQSFTCLDLTPEALALFTPSSHGEARGKKNSSPGVPGKLSDKQYDFTCNLLEEKILVSEN